MRARKIGVALATSAVATLVLGVGWAPAAFAAVPSNDTIQTATEITSIPFSDSVDTTEATTDALEASLQAPCGAPAVEHGVWYHATVAESGTYTADTSQSDYGTGIMVLAGPVDSPTLLTCGPTSITGPLEAGQEVFLLVFGDGTTAQTSGNMVLTVEAAAPPPTVDVSINSRGSFGRDGSATISGTITCTGADSVDFTDIFGDVQQRVGRAIISNFLETQPDVTCDGAPHSWSGTASGDNGRFAGGHVDVEVFAEVCSSGVCGDAQASATVQLSGGPKH